MARSIMNSPVSPDLQRVFDLYHEEAQRLQEKYGDPEEALSSFIREHFDREALEEALIASLEGEGLWNDDEEPDGR